MSFAEAWDFHDEEQRQKENQKKEFTNWENKYLPILSHYFTALQEGENVHENFTKNDDALFKELVSLCLNEEKRKTFSFFKEAKYHIEGDVSFELYQEAFEQTFEQFSETLRNIRRTPISLFGGKESLLSFKEQAKLATREHLAFFNQHPIDYGKKVLKDWEKERMQVLKTSYTKEEEYVRNIVRYGVESFLYLQRAGVSYFSHHFRNVNRKIARNNEVERFQKAAITMYKLLEKIQYVQDEFLSNRKKAIDIQEKIRDYFYENRRLYENK